MLRVCLRDALISSLLRGLALLVVCGGLGCARTPVDGVGLHGSCADGQKCAPGSSCLKWRSPYDVATCEIACDAGVPPPEGDHQCPAGLRCVGSDHGPAGSCQTPRP